MRSPETIGSRRGERQHSKWGLKYPAPDMWGREEGAARSQRFGRKPEMDDCRRVYDAGPTAGRMQAGSGGAGLKICAGAAQRMALMQQAMKRESLICFAKS